MNTSIMGTPCDFVFNEKMGAVEQLCLRAPKSLSWHRWHSHCTRARFTVLVWAVESELKFQAPVPERFDSLKSKHHSIICTTRLPHKLCLWNWNPNFRLWLYHLKVFGSGSNHPTVLRLGSGSTALILVSCSCEFAVHSCPLLCLQKQVAKLAKGFFNCWSLLRNSTMAINLQSSLEATVVGVLPHVTVEVERRRLGG